MKLDVTNLIKNETDVVGISFDFAEPEIDYYGEIIEFNDSVKVKGSAKRIIDQLFIEMEIEVSITTRCARCLKEVHKPLLIKTFDELLPIAKEKEVEQDENVLFYDSYHLDLLDCAREQLLLRLPFKTVCQEDCPGICTRCGGNLNEEACECNKADTKEDELDPRFAQLRDWLQNTKE